MKTIYSLFSLFLIQAIIGISIASAYISTASAPISMSSSFNTCHAAPNHDPCVYFQGTDNRFYKIHFDDPDLNSTLCDNVNDNTATKATALGDAQIISSPALWYDDSALTGWAFFQGPNNELWKVRLDGTQLTDLHLQALSSPAVIMESNGLKIYFENPNHELCMANDDGTGLTDLGDQVFSTPRLVYGVHKTGCSSTSTLVFYQGTNHTLTKCEMSGWTSKNPESAITRFNAFTKSTPIVVWAHVPFTSYVYFQDENDHFMQVDLNGNSMHLVTSRTILSAPCYDLGDRELFFQTGGDVICRVDPGFLYGSDSDPLFQSKLTILSTPCYVHGDNTGLYTRAICFQSDRNQLISTTIYTRDSSHN